MDFLCHLHRISVGLAIDVQQHGWLPVRRDHRVDGFHAGRHRGHIANPHGDSRRRVLDHCIGNFFGRFHLAVDQTEIELVIALQQSWRVDKIGSPHGIQDVGHGHSRRQQLGRVWRDVKFRFLSALHDHGGYAFQAIEARLHLIRRHLPQLGLRHAVRGEAIADDGKSGEGQAVGLDLRGGGEFRLHPRNCGVDILQSLEHVHVPAEVKIHLRRPPTGDGAHCEQSGHAVDGFLDGTGYGDRHLVDGHDAVVDRDQHARKIRGREDRHGDGEGEIRAQQTESQDEKDDRPGVLGDPMHANRGLVSRRTGSRGVHADAPLRLFFTGSLTGSFRRVLRSLRRSFGSGDFNPGLVG